MDFSEAAKVVFNRIQSFEPKNASKIVGFLLLQDNGDHEMIRIALGPDTLIKSLIHRTKTSLGLPGSIPRGPLNFHRHRFSGLNFVFPQRTCHYFNKGFCKHGSDCKYFHGNEHFDEDSDHLVSLSPRTLERLEIEITELLRSRRGFPVSIASLPMMYYEKYGRSLQAEGYLTESQRHGKTGYSLTKLLARLKNSICLIDRPHGQHSVILVEDLPRYAENFMVERNSGIVSGSRQIYLTFPAESTFTEHDVSNYFNKFGPVQDVRIPCQHERMFGFVTFAFPESVRHVLSKGNPHFVCEARVLVKPYREKLRLVNGKFSERMLQPLCQNYLDGDLEFSPMPLRAFDKLRIKKHNLLENEQAFELERRSFSEMNLASRVLSHRPSFNYLADHIKIHEGHRDFQSHEQFHYMFDAMNNASTSEENEFSTDRDDQDSQGLNLPESPFASTIGNEISAFT